MKDIVMIDWTRIWNDDDAIRRISPTQAILYFLSLFYRLSVYWRNRFYDRQILKPVKLSCPVISVGNIAVGGTGKTPCVVGLAKMLQQHGYQPGVISRGYGGRSAEPVNVVSDGKTILLDARTVGDEPLLIAKSLPGVPVITGARRNMTGQAAIDLFGVQALICDDAFQHRQIFRDIDIVLLDAEKPLGNGHLLPRGELREPKEELNRAGCLILTRDDQTEPMHPDVARIAGTFGIPVFRAAHKFKEMTKHKGNMRLSPGDLLGKKICAFCGIARPESFRKLLREAGTEILSFIDFPDHYAYNHVDLDAIKKHFLTLDADYWVTTEKDAMRLTGYPDFLETLFVVRIEMEIKPSVPTFENFIMERLAALIKK